MRSQIIGSGFVTGENLVTNDQLARIMDTSDAWIRERSGVETRYYVEQGTSTSDLGLGAARKALADAGIAKEEVDYIVFATMTPDHYFPGCGGILQEKLGVAHVRFAEGVGLGAFDVEGTDDLVAIKQRDGPDSAVIEQRHLTHRFCAAGLDVQQAQFSAFAEADHLFVADQQ